MEHIVLYEGITKIFGNIVALNDITLAVQRGDFLSLLGPSGCGKTTLLRTCAGLETPTTGRVLLDGKDVTYTPPHKRPVNMVFQNWALFPHKTVAENVAFGLVVKKTPRSEIAEQVKAMLNLVKMQGYEDRYPKQLSGGQTQRIALARALVMQPKVLLLDEPLGSLDLKLRKEMQIELINIHKQLGTTFIYVTHDQEEALTMSDRVVIMNEGTIIQQGLPSEIYQKPNSVFSAQFIGETILFKGKIESMNGTHCHISTGEFDLRCAAKPDLEIGQHVSVSIRPERVRISSLAEEGLDNSLEGMVINTIFKGPSVHYQVRISDGQILTVVQSLEQDAPLYHAESIVHLSWAAQDGVVLVE